MIPVPRLDQLLDLRLRIAAIGPVHPDVAWARYTDVDRWTGWAPQLREVRTDGPRVLVPGLTGRAFGPLRVRVDFVVTEVDDTARTWVWEVRAGPARLVLRHGVEATAGGGSRTWLDLTGPAPLVVGYVPVARHALRRLVTRPADDDAQDRGGRWSGARPGSQ